MNSCFTLEPFTIPEHRMTDEYPPPGDLESDSSMSTVAAAFEEEEDSTTMVDSTLMCVFDMPHGISAHSSRYFSASPSIVTPTFKSVSATFRDEPSFEPIPDIAHNNIVAFENPLHPLLEPAPIFQSTEDASSRSVSPSDASSACTSKSAAELDQVCKARIEKLRESLKRSSATRQAVMRQWQALKV
ncbi:unnamed protein product [Cylindrotheca closterium]|uniref:Uncharacterized protein n=1 Tax=Cylindrotheca closterium TaxID=2856 RepID=A0AAD2CE00_9STRA|nr:unnamed protein product [Cylindrotheca closterium]